MPLAADAWHSPAGEAPLEDYLATLDAAGIGRAVLAAASLYGDYNDYMIAAVRAHRRLRATAIVDPATDPYVLRQMRDDGIVGVRFQWRPLAQHPDLDSWEYRKLLRRIADLGWHVQLHDEGPRLPDAIARIEASGAILVIDHFGRPDPRLGVDCPGFQAVLRAVERGRCWVKLSGAFRIGPPELVDSLAQALLHHAGPERLLWGSDWPFVAHEGAVDYAATLATFERLVPRSDQRDAIHRTASRLYFGDDGNVTTGTSR